VKSARKITDQVGRVVNEVERGKGLAHALVYDEPVALRKLNDLVASTQALVEARAARRGRRRRAHLRAVDGRRQALRGRDGQAEPGGGAAVARRRRAAGAALRSQVPPHARRRPGDRPQSARGLDRVAGGRRHHRRARQGRAGRRQHPRDVARSAGDDGEPQGDHREDQRRRGHGRRADRRPTIYERLVSILDGARAASCCAAAAQPRRQLKDGAARAGRDGKGAPRGKE
jgi:hypothetical protein